MVKRKLPRKPVPGDWICEACTHLGPPIKDKPFKVDGHTVLAMVCAKCDSEDIFAYGTPEEIAEHEATCAEDTKRKEEASAYDDYDYY